jgi:VWFA-related protein
MRRKKINVKWRAPRPRAAHTGARVIESCGGSNRISRSCITLGSASAANASMSRSIGRISAAAITSATLAILLAGSSSPAARSQEQQRQPVFRGGANYVNVDVYPRRGGQIVNGLTEKDFQVFEDGKPQTIEKFEFIRIESYVPDAERRDPNTKEEGDRLLDDPRRRVFVIFLDDYHISRDAAFYVRAPLVEFLQRTIGPSDLFAAMTPDISVRDMVFGQRLETIEAALAGFWRRMQFEGPDPNTLTFRTAHEEFLYDCYNGRTGNHDLDEAFIRKLIDLWRLDLLFTGLEQVSARLGALREERSNVLLFSSGWALDMPRDSKNMAWGASLPQIGVTRSGKLTTNPTQPHSQDKTKCDTEYFRLVDIDFRQRFIALLDDARRSNVSFTTVDPAGLQAPAPVAIPGAPPKASADATLANLRRFNDQLDSLRTLADNTGGVAIVNTNDLRTPLLRVTDNVGTYYLLGYYSTNLNHDGKYRRIEVKVAGSNINVAARPGYRDVTAEVARAAEHAPSASAPSRPGSSEVEQALGALGRLRPSADLFTYGVAWPGRLAIAVELPAQSAPRWTSGAEVQATVTTVTGESVGTVRGRIEPSTRAVLLSVPLGQPPAAPWRVAVRVDGGGGRLDDRLDVGAPASDAVGQPLLFRATPSPQSPLRPAADRQFFRTERLHVEWPVIQTLDSQEARVLGRNGQPLAFPVKVVTLQRDGQAVVAVDLNLAPLAAGDYVLELSGTRGANTEKDLVAFRVTR